MILYKKFRLNFSNIKMIIFISFSTIFIVSNLLGRPAVSLQKLIKTKPLGSFGLSKAQIDCKKGRKMRMLSLRSRQRFPFVYQIDSFFTLANTFFSSFFPTTPA